MSNDNVIQLIQPGIFDDQLTEVLRNGARALLAKAVEAEVADFLDKHADLKTRDGHQRVVRHGHLPEREVMTGIGPVAVRQPRVRDRSLTTTVSVSVPLTTTISVSVPLTTTVSVSLTTTISDEIKHCCGPTAGHREHRIRRRRLLIRIIRRYPKHRVMVG